MRVRPDLPIAESCGWPLPETACPPGIGTWNTLVVYGDGPTGAGPLDDARSLRHPRRSHQSGLGDEHAAGRSGAVATRSDSAAGAAEQPPTEADARFSSGGCDVCTGR